MYIRKIKKRNGRTKKLYSYLHLVENIRTPKGPRQKLILNLGNIDLDPSLYTILARRIEELLTGQKTLFPVEPKIERYAKDAYKKILHKKSQEERSKHIAEYKNVDINSIKANDVRSYGLEYVCTSIWNELELDTVFRATGINKDSLSIIKAAVISRLIEPGSELNTKSWAEERSALYEICGRPTRNSLQSYYRATDKILQLKEDIEKHLGKKEKDLFKLDETICLFDLTNTYFEGISFENPKAKYGRSKEKRSDCKLATLAMIVDRSGFPKYSRFYPGNQYEASTLKEIIKQLEERTDASKKLIVIDAGIATEENIKWLKENGYKYIAVSRKKKGQESDFEDRQTVREDAEKGIKIEISSKKVEDEILILCKSEYKRRKEENMRIRVEQLFLDRIEYYKDGLVKKGRMKNYQKIIEAIGRIREKYPKASKLYTVEVKAEEAKKKKIKQLNAVAIIVKQKEEKSLKERETEGAYILRTNEINLKAEEIWEYYILQGRIEKAFKALKSHLGLRPNFHRIEKRVDAHMFISVLAYHILNTIEHKLRAKGDNRAFPTIRKVLSTHKLLSLEYNTKEEDIIYRNVMRLASEPEFSHKVIYESLNLNSKRFKRKIFKIKISSDEKYS